MSSKFSLNNRFVRIGILLIAISGVSVLMLAKESGRNKPVTLNDTKIFIAEFMKNSGFPPVKGFNAPPVGYTLSVVYIFDTACVDCVVSDFTEALQNNGWDVNVRKMDEYLFATLKEYKDSLSNKQPVDNGANPPINQKAAEYLINTDDKTIQETVKKFVPTVIEGRRKQDGLECMISIAGTAGGKKVAVTIQVASR